MKMPSSLTRCALFLFGILVLPLQGLFAQQSVLIRWVPENSDKASYILAVLHNKDVTQYNLSNVPSEVFPLVNTIAFEWLQEQYEKEQADVIMQTTDDNSLKKYYTRDNNIRYELMILNELQDNVEQYADFMPLYTLHLFRSHERGAGQEFQERTLYDYALASTKPVLSLLSMRQIAAQMNLVDFETQADILSSYVNDLETQRQYEKDKFNLYGQQDLSGIALAASGAENPAYLNSMRTSINKELTQKMLQLSMSQSVLYVIDAERLGGMEGILAMLRMANAEVSDVPFVLPTNNQSDNADAYNNMEIEPDYFPEEMLEFLSSETSNKARERLIRVDELTQENVKDFAYTDPFGDRYDYLANDTSFIGEWFELRSNDAFFTIRLPEKSKWVESTTESINGPIRTNTANVNHARSDLFYSIGYTIYPPNFNLDQKAAFFDDFVYRSIRKMNGELLSQRIISDPEFSGREFVVVVEDSFYVRSRIYLRGNILYQLLTGGPGNKPYSDYAEEFLRNFRMDKGRSTNWYTYTEPGISCEFPREPLIQNQSYNTQYGPLQIKSFNAEDFNDGLSYFLSINQYPAGYKFKGDKAFYSDLISDAEKQYFGRAISTEKVKKGRNSGREVILQLNNGKMYQMQFFIIDNLVYQYLVGGTPGALQSPNVRYFLDHFRFEE